MVIEQRAGRREWTALAVLTLPLLIVSMDVSVLFFAVPQIAESLQPTATQLLWIFDIYGFVLAGLLLTMGNVADRIGRRRLLLIGAAAFGAASTLAAFAPSAEALILARALLGVGGATLMPSTLAIIRSLFHDEAERARAVGIWSAVLAGGVAVGPILSGFLLERFWWGSVFLINVPFMVLLLVAAPFLVPESKSRSARVDLLSSALSLVAILSGIHAIKTGAADGPSLEVAVAAIVAIIGTAAFLRRQGRIASPMVDLALFGARGFRGSIAIQVIAMFGVMGSAILLTQYFQSVLGMSPLEAALWSLAPALVVGAGAPMSAALATRVGRPVVIAGGFVLAAAGFALMLAAGVASPLWLILIAATLIATGLVAVATLVTAYALGVAPSERAGSVSALIETAGEFGGALGMAVLGSIASVIYATQVVDLLPGGMSPAAASAAGETLGGATAVAGQLPADLAQAVMTAARASYVDAIHVTYAAGIGVLIAGAIVALLALPRHVSAQPRERDASGAPVPKTHVYPSGSL